MLVKSNVVDILKIRQGKNPYYVSLSEPEDKTLLWLDISGNDPQLKIYNEDKGKWEIVNSESIKKEYTSAIKQESDSITATVSSKYYSSDDGKTLYEKVTSLEQTANGWTHKFINASGNPAEEYIEGHSDQIKRIYKYIHFIDGNIVIANDNSTSSALNITNDKVFFSVNEKNLYKNTEDEIEDIYKPLVIDSEGKAKMNDLDVKDRITIGNFGFFPRSNGNLSFKKIK